MKNQLFGPSVLLAASMAVSVSAAIATPAMAKIATAPSKSTASVAASKLFKFSNGGTAVFNSKKIAQATQVNPLVPNPTLNTGAPAQFGVPVPPLLPGAARWGYWRCVL
jgi:hypothetical protein